jgi:sugar phosphate isomerase/epimerase
MTWCIGASTGCCQQTPIIDVIRVLADIAVPAIEIGTPPGHFDIWQPSQVEAIKHELSRTGVRAVAIHAPFGGLLDLSDPNPHHRHAGMGAIMTAAAVLHELRGQIVVIHATDVIDSVPDAALRLQHACNSVHALQSACAAMGMTLAIESPLPHLIGGSPQQFARLLDAAGPDARVCLDTGHTWLGHHWTAFADLASGRLVHVHAHDNDGVFDDHKPPGDGRIDWTVVARDLRHSHYDGWLMLELACPREPLCDYFRRSERQLRARLDDIDANT